MAQRLLVVGGNGFVGSSICKQALLRGWDVVSISSSGQPFRTPQGHVPAWAQGERMAWRKADAFDPASYKGIAASCTAAVHTMGILLESAYKGQRGSIGGIVQGLAKGLGLSSDNPLKPSDGITYERINRDAALVVANTVAAAQRAAGNSQVPFVYLSAADIMRPIIPARYISTKYEAEEKIEAIADADTPHALRPIFMRPGFMYHPHNRPWSTVPATFIDASHHLHRLHAQWRLPFPTPAALLQSKYAPTGLHPLAGALTTPPLHVDTVGKAICEAIADPHIHGPQDSAAIHALAGWQTPS